MFAWFERLVHPYPDALPATPPARFWPFMWAATEGLRPYIVAMVLFTAAIGVFEALLFAMLGNIVDWLARVAPAGMIFIPCKDGISHNEIEDAKPEHIEAGCNVLLQAMLSVARATS